MTSTDISSEHLLRLPQVKALTGLSRTTLYTLMSDGDFPEAIKLSERNVAWVASEIHTWIAERIKSRRNKR